MIYVLGSMNMDMVANVDYMPKRGETLTATGYMVNCGGKGANQAVAVAKLGGNVAMIARVGGDAYGAEMKQNLVKHAINVDNVTISDIPSGTAMIIVDKGDNRIILNKGANHDWDKRYVDQGLANGVSGDILLMQMEVPLDIIEYALKVAKAKGMSTILNPAPAVKLSDQILSNVDIITPNESETEILTGIDPIDEPHMVLAVKNLYSKGVKNVIITLGSRGAIVSHGQELTPIEPRKVKVIDTTAAGDTFVGAVATSLQVGVDIVEACRYASVASSITITRKGASSSIPTKSEVDEIYNTTKSDTTR